MGTPSDGKTFPPDRYCRICGEILFEDEYELCDDCAED